MSLLWLSESNEDREKKGDYVTVKSSPYKTNKSLCSFFYFIAITFQQEKKEEKKKKIFGVLCKSYIIFAGRPSAISYYVVPALDLLQRQPPRGAIALNSLAFSSAHCVHHKSV